MDLARSNYKYLTEASQPGSGVGRASAALTARILDELLTTPETSRNALASALQESYRQFESLLSFVSGTFYRSELAPPWKMEFISPGIAAISGYGPDYFVHTPFGNLIVPEDRPALDAAIAEAIARHEHFAVCYRIRHRSGAIRWVSEKGGAVYDENGRPRFVEGFISDVTESKDLEAMAERARKEADELNDQMSRILAHTLEGIVSFDADWNYRFTNRTAGQHIHSVDGLIGKSIFEINPSFLHSAAWPAMEHAMATREAVRTECHIEKSDGWYEVYAVPDSSGVTAFFRNITDRKRLEQALLTQAEDLRNTLDSIPDMVWTARPDGRSEYYNRAMNDFLGRSQSDPMSPTAEWIHLEDCERALVGWTEALGSGRPFEQEMRMRHHSGEYRWLLARAWPQRDESGEIVKWCGAATDIHERILAEGELRESQNLQTNILEASTDCIQITDLDGHVMFVNSTAERSINVENGDSPVGKHWTEIWPEQSQAAAREAYRQARQGEVARMVECHPDPSGAMIWWDIILSPIKSTEGEICNVLCVASNVTEQKEIAERLRIASEQDVLTGLPNRRAFDKHLKDVTARAGDAGTNVGLMLVDLDHFKHVNDTLGHLAGDYLLQVVAARLKTCVKELGFVARLGGDEFAIVLEGIGEEHELVATAASILARMEVPVTFAGKLINGGLSIGCAVFPRDGSDAQSLLQHTDTALYDLKASGRGGIQMFNNRMMEAAERTASQLNLARNAIRDDAVQPHYQPKVRLETGEIAGFEALLRWWSPGNGIQPPSSVAEAFNDYELSTKIGSLMQRRIFADISAWREQGLTLLPVSINAAPAEFLRDDYAERLFDRLDEFSIPPSLIEVEITEHVLLERRSEHIIRALELLKKAGVRIALDDFGTGHSSLSHLRDFPVDVLKIDRSFVSRMLTKPRMLAIVQAITTLGPSLSLDIVAEGVESPEQLHTLRDAGCRFGQGYLFGKAMDAAEVGKRLAANDWPFKVRPLRGA